MKMMKKLQMLLLVFILMFASLFQFGNVFAQEDQLTQQAVTAVGVTYQTHVQNLGWTQGWVSDGALSGTEGQSLRMEAMEIKLVNAPANASIEYYVHVQNLGDQKPNRVDGQLAGTEGQSLRLEAVHINLLNMPGYAVQYRVHVQNLGWQAWVSDGAIAGTTGQSLRLEAVEIRIVNTNPVIQLIGSNPAPTNLIVVPTGVTDAYADPGVVAKDYLGADITSSVVVTGTVNTLVAGSYQLTYT
ncbi:MAG: immunoglobulin-like domain-containing protein, partial [Acetobacterium sp.]